MKPAGLPGGWWRGERIARRRVGIFRGRRSRVPERRSRRARSQALFASDATPGDEAGLGVELASGAVEGLALAVLCRHLPSGRLVRIGLCGAARYAAAPRGGLPRVIRPIAPATVRTLSALAPGGGRSGGLLEHAAFAAAFVLLYGRRTSGSGQQRADR